MAEDQALLREGIVRLLENQDEVEVVGSTGDLTALYQLVVDEEPDVVVTDIRMPPTQTDEGIQAAAHLRDNYPEVGVVVLSQYSEPQYALDLLADGSERRAYLLKERVSDVEDLVRAIKEVAAGGSVVDPKVVDALVDARSKRK